MVTEPAMSSSRTVVGRRAANRVVDDQAAAGAGARDSEHAGILTLLGGAGVGGGNCDRRWRLKTGVAYIVDERMGCFA